jgi:microcystin-dependent protein
MKYSLLFCFLILFATICFGQQANFQGKIYINGQPANGLHTINFFIGPPLNWSSVPKTINITNGLYSTVIDFPPDLFDYATASREMIAILDSNNPIDTVTLFAPLERDPTVRSYFLDSISWANVHNKPPVDTSFSNEIQTLSINGDTLKISDGNFVLFPDMSKDLTVNGKFKVIDTSIHQSFSGLGSSYTSCIGAANQSYWQSFKAIESGKLRQITVPVAASCNNYVTVYIYAGQGSSSQYLGYKSCPVNNALTLQTLDLTSGISSSTNGYISLSIGTVYTFQLTPPVGCSITVGCNNTDPYTEGISNIAVGTDIPFALHMDKSAPPNFTILKNGNVGIGVDSPTVQLEVKGRIKDQTGFLMPVGTVCSYAGDDIPEGWLLCDGRPVSRSAYNDLYKAIKNGWGSGDNSSTFNLPDLRGQFLRGVDNSPTQGTSGADPDKDVRTANAVGGNIGNLVGSKQTDIFAAHSHNSIGTYLRYVFPSGYLKVQSGTDTDISTITTGNTGGNETRPKNAYVYYIIKY